MNSNAREIEMSKFNLNSECTACGICVDRCPMALISSDTEGMPFLAKEKDESCLLCGHCASSCPSKAIRLEGPLLKESSDPEADGFISADSISAYMASRRSIRNYRPDAVSRELVGKILDAVRYAPTGINRQETKWIIASGSKKVHELAGLTIDWARKLVEMKHPMAEQMRFARLIDGWDKGADPICRNAPMLILAYAHKDDRMAPTDGVIALSHFELAAPAFGLGACWAGYFNVAANMYAPLKEALGIPADHIPLGTLMFGYPDEKYLRIPARNAVDMKWIG